MLMSITFVQTNQHVSLILLKFLGIASTYVYLMLGGKTRDSMNVFSKRNSEVMVAKTCLGRKAKDAFVNAQKILDSSNEFPACQASELREAIAARCAYDLVAIIHAFCSLSARP